MNFNTKQTYLISSFLVKYSLTVKIHKLINFDLQVYESMLLFILQEPSCLDPL